MIPATAHCAIAAHALVAIAVVMTAGACRKPEAPPDAVAARGAAVDAPPPDAPPPDAPGKPAPTPTRLAASGDTTCAVMSDATVACWGGNARGQLGNGHTEDSAAPVVPAIHAVVDLQLADATACALLDDASVACWGRIAWHGRTEDTLRPTGVLGVIGVKQIFVVPNRACARLANDRLVCWGDVDARGHFAAGAANRLPTPVVGIDHVAGLTADGAFSDDGRVWRWGKDGVPKRIDIAGAKEIASRDGALCARLDDGRVLCSDPGRCGPPPAPPAPPPAPPVRSPARGAKPKPGARPAKPVPAKPAPAPPPAPPLVGEPAVAFAVPAARQLAFSVGFCVVTTRGKLQCGDGCKKLDPVYLERVEQLVGRCAILKSGTIACSDGTKFDAIDGIMRATQVASGRAHGCAIAHDAIGCWGDNTHGQLGPYAVGR